MARAAALLAVVSATLAFAVTQGCTAFGGKPDEDDRARFAASPQWRDGRFHNRQPMWNDLKRGLGGFLVPALPDAVPAPGSVPTARPDWSTPPATGLRVTWFGHASTLVEIDGRGVLLDPIWSARPSPLPFVGPQRWFAPPVPLQALPRVDVVLISHDHYDHLDAASVVELARRPELTFVVPLGVGAHLQRWGIERARIRELDWWQTVQVAGLDITATPARHASGRLDPQSMHTLWAGFAVHGPTHRVWASGDTGTHDDLDAIGARLGPFDLTLIENGQYDAAWPDWHLGPEFAVQAHRRVRGRHLLPVHWALFKLAHHGWTEPGERVLAATRCQRISLLLPKPGETVEPERAPAPQRWWPTRPWADAATASIRPTRDGQDAHRLPQPACDAPEPRRVAAH